MFTPSIERLLKALQALPGVGPRSAQRMVLHLLERDRPAAQEIAEAMGLALSRVKRCENCRNYAEDDLCSVCADESREASMLCIVETPTDLIAIQKATHYRGYFFVLLGQLSPLDGIGPEALGFDLLHKRLKSGKIKELILATGTTIEGEATASYLADLAASCDISATRLAHGVPLGGELEYVDSGTLAHAFMQRGGLSND
ncbi:MAG: recombination mediator RecR [bacterium]